MSRTVSLDSVYEPIDGQLRSIPGTILDILSTPNELASDVIRYFFSSRGKLLRPALSCLGFAIKNGKPELESRLLHLAASYEIFHAATLIHDDIVDSAYLRRNIPTVNVKWGPQTAVLVGDYLHDKAMGSIFQNGKEKIFSIFLQTAGLVCDGEIHELKEKDNFNLTENEYLEIVDKKTAVLLACSVQTGGILAGATPEEAEALKRFGRYFGIAFQIVDDCLDFTGNQEEFGKTLGADCAAGVLTLPLIRLIQLVDEKAKSEVFKIFSATPPKNWTDPPSCWAEKIGGSAMRFGGKSEMGTNKFQILLSMIREHGTIEYSMNRALEFTEKARLELSIFPDTPAKQSLLNLVDYVLERNK